METVAELCSVASSAPCAAQTHLLREATIYGGLDPPASVNNQTTPTDLSCSQPDGGATDSLCSGVKLKTITRHRHQRRFLSQQILMKDNLGLQTSLEGMWGRHWADTARAGLWPPSSGPKALHNGRQVSPWLNSAQSVEGCVPWVWAPLQLPGLAWELYVKRLGQRGQQGVVS